MDFNFLSRAKWLGVYVIITPFLQLCNFAYILYLESIKYLLFIKEGLINPIELNL